MQILLEAGLPKIPHYQAVVGQLGLFHGWIKGHVASRSRIHPKLPAWSGGFRHPHPPDPPEVDSVLRALSDLLHRTGPHDYSQMRGGNREAFGK